MLVQFYLPEKLSPVQLDDMLAGGWFRNSQMMFRSKLVCLEGDYFSPVNIRSNLNSFQFSKNQRKLIRKLDKRFRVEFGPLEITPEKSALYEAQKHKFRGFVFEDLENYLNSFEEESHFQTRECRVYDGEKLIALSLFDLGHHSVASLLGLYDQGYLKESLGFYTLLKEVEFAIQNSKEYYYPGFVLGGKAIFDYKLRLAKLEYFDWKGKWASYSSFDQEKTLAARLRKGIIELKEALDRHGIWNRLRIYPYFSLAYSENDHLFDLAKYPVFLELVPIDEENGGWIAEYMVNKNVWRICKVQSLTHYLEMSDIQFDEPGMDHDDYMLDVMEYDRTPRKTRSPEDLAKWIIRRKPFRL